MYKTKTLAAISKTHEQRQGKGFRNHLGASIIGRECARQIWYTHRWAKKSAFTARILRLFDRGNREEEVLASLLRKAGIHVLTLDNNTGKQYRIEDYHGHFGGSLDAVLFDAPDFPGQWVLGEFKTHNDKSFKDLVKRGIEKSKYEHYVQAQIYMRYTELPNALYFGVNKNDDDIDISIVKYNAAVAEKYAVRAGKIIFTTSVPDRINESPAYYLCRMCTYKDICHDHMPKAVNCRTCQHSRPVPSEDNSGEWVCTYHGHLLSLQEQKVGCKTHSPIPEN